MVKTITVNGNITTIHTPASNGNSLRKRAVNEILLPGGHSTQLMLFHQQVTTGDSLSKPLLGLET